MRALEATLLIALTTAAHAWIGGDGQYNFSISDSGDVDAPAVTFTDITLDPAAVMLGISSIDDSAETLSGISTQPVIFYGNTYTPEMIYVGTNGQVMFDETMSNGTSSIYFNDAIPTFSPDYPSIFPFWTDLNPSSGGSIWALDDGDSLWIQWQQVPFFSAGGSNTVQVQIVRSTSQIWVSIDEQIGADFVSIGMQAGPNLGVQAYFGQTPMTSPAPVTFLFSPDEGDDDGDGFAGIHDCNDFDATINPDAIEVCDGVDNNCNGQADEAGTIQNWYEDMDGDGWGDVNNAFITDGCSPPAGYGPEGDCDDSDEQTRPNRPENCDPVDRNCDGSLYDGATNLSPYQVDADGDGWGVPPTHWTCELPADAATIGTGDCDDTQSDVYPDAPEIPFNGIDNNCDERELDDRDHDGFNDSDEYFYGSDWRDDDTDDDGILDGPEFEAGGNLLVSDTDGDGVPDAVEFPFGDTDGDGANDINDDDDDDDGWSTSVEGTGDWDGDGVADYLDVDSDGDTILDADETAESRLRVDEPPPSEDNEDGAKGCGCSTESAGIGWWFQRR